MINMKQLISLKNEKLLTFLCPASSHSLIAVLFCFLLYHQSLDI